jgi:acid stress-induced BolA-like protein IbaG/YrbA
MSQLTLRQRIKKVLQDAFPRARVVITPGHDGDDLHVKVISRMFAGKHLGEKADMLGSVFTAGLTHDEWGKISLAVGQTPEEARKNGSFSL